MNFEKSKFFYAKLLNPNTPQTFPGIMRVPSQLSRYDVIGFKLTDKQSTEAEFKEFEPRFKFKPALNLNRVLVDLSRDLNSLNLA